MSKNKTNYSNHDYINDSIYDVDGNRNSNPDSAKGDLEVQHHKCGG